MKNGAFCLSYANDELKDDKEFMIAVLSIYGLDLKEASDRLKDDRDFILKIISINGGNLSYASIRLQKDKELIELAVSSCPFVLWFLPDEIKKDEAFMTKIQALISESEKDNK